MGEKLEVLRRLTDSAPADRWHAELLTVGLLAELGPEPPDHDARDVWEARRAVLVGLRELHERGARVTELGHPLGMFVGVPRAVWIGLVVGVVGLTVFLPFVIAAALTALAFGAVALGGLPFVAAAERKRRLDLAAEQAAYRACASRIRAAAERALAPPGGAT